jgi:hypothetical protein
MRHELIGGQYDLCELFLRLKRKSVFGAARQPTG